MATHVKKDVYQIITDIIIERLEKGSIPWHQPWGAFGPAANYITKKPYRGINSFILNSIDHEIPYFLTFKQASDLGGKVKKGSKSLPVTYWNFFYYDKENKKKITQEQARNLPFNQASKSAFLKYYSVFNVADIEGIDFKYPEVLTKEDNETIKNCETIFSNMPQAPALNHGGHQAFYSPKEDLVNMPEMKLFNSSEDYYLVLFHELTHSTGHEKRLARKEVMERNAFGSEDYSKEELTAEMGASFLTGIAGIQTPHTIEHSVAYVENWLQQFESDKTFLIEAAGKAQKAADYILNIQKGD